MSERGRFTEDEKHKICTWYTPYVGEKTGAEHVLRDKFTICRKPKKCTECGEMNAVEEEQRVCAWIFLGDFDSYVCCCRCLHEMLDEANETL